MSGLHEECREFAACSVPVRALLMLSWATVGGWETTTTTTANYYDCY